MFTTGLAVLCTLLGAGRIVYHEHKAAQLRELGRYLVTYVLVSGAAAGAASVLIGGSDQMASWFINQASAHQHFADHLANLLGLATAGTSHAAGAPAGFTVGLAGTVTTAFIAIVLGIIAFLATVIQIMLMLVRGGMLVLLVGTLPLVAAFSNTEMGLQWFRKASAWLVAFALYKPAAAIVYAVAFDLAGQPGALALLDGVMMLVLAILALPALLRFVVPATSALAGGGGAGAMLAGAAGGAIAMRMPTGAASVARRPRARTGKAGRGGPSGAALAGGGPAGRGGHERRRRRSPGSGRGQNGQSGASGQQRQRRPAGWRLRRSPSGRARSARRRREPRARARAAAVRPARRARSFRRTGPAKQRGERRGGVQQRDGGDGPTGASGKPELKEGSVMAAEAQVERTYGNWRRPRPPGLWHLGLISSVLLIVGLIAAIIVIALVGLIPGLVLLAAMLPVFLVTLRPDPHGQTPMQRLGMRLGWRRARASRSHLYRSGPLGRTPYGTFQLPGLLAASQLSEARDTYDRPFAVLCHPWCEQLTVVLETEPDGAALVDQPQVDQWVAHYGQWLAALSQEPGLIACQVSVETAPDPGTRLRHAIAGPAGPERARARPRDAVGDRSAVPGRRGRSESQGRADVQHGRGRPAADRDRDRARPRDPARRDHAAAARDGRRGRDAGRRAAAVRDRSRRL